MRTLKDVKVGETVTVVKIQWEGALKQRIMDMGIIRERSCTSGKSPRG
jgi:ferrous iron transport protein A